MLPGKERRKRLAMVKQICLVAVLACTMVTAAAAQPSSQDRFKRCLEMHQRWTRYETANCPNQTGQRAQAEWALSRCQVGDFDRGLAELERLLRRNLIPLP
jgi:hypothetical protein